MKIRIACAGRTVVGDITPMIEISQRAGIPIEVYAFIGSSPIRQYVEQWDVALIAKRSAEAIDVAVKAGLPVAYVTEDTTRSRPEVLTTLFRAGHRPRRVAPRACRTRSATRRPTACATSFSSPSSVIAGTGAEVGIDWHGHNDRGLALENALWALEFGADRVHGTALGIGERVGNAAMELLLLNLRLLGQLRRSATSRSSSSTARPSRGRCGWQIPLNYPLVGRDAFRTATGVHAAAIIKADAEGRRVAGRPRLQRRARGHVRAAPGDLHRVHERRVERQLLAAPAGHRAERETSWRRSSRPPRRRRHILSDEEVMAVVSRVRG